MITFDTNNQKSFKIILNHLNILYIEDEKNIRINMTKTLELFAAKVHAVETIDEASEILNKNRIDLIISDINLPGISGIDFVKSLRKRNFCNPIILLSAYTDKDYLLEATKLKLVDYLVKPIDFEALKTALHQACKEIVENASFIINFNNEIVYNVLEKRLSNRLSNQNIDLTAKELTLLEFFIINHTRVITHQEIKENIWEDSFEATDSALKNLLNKLRKKIGKDSIENISGVGFRVNIN